MTVVCKPGNTVCHVRAVYDFDVSNAARHRHSHGAGLHDPDISFTADRAMIISESSRVLGDPGIVTK